MVRYYKCRRCGYDGNSQSHWCNVAGGWEDGEPYNVPGLGENNPSNTGKSSSGNGKAAGVLILVFIAIAVIANVSSKNQAKQDRLPVAGNLNIAQSVRFVNETRQTIRVYVDDYKDEEGHWHEPEEDEALVLRPGDTRVFRDNGSPVHAVLVRFTVEVGKEERLLNSLPEDLRNGALEIRITPDDL